MEGKNIKVYGTLINQTQNTDSSMSDSQHNDLIAVAYQLFDERFSPKKGSGANDAVTNIDRYQDIINKRLTAISYDSNGDITNIYSNLYVDGDTNIGGDLTVEGDTTFEGDINITGDINLNIGLDDLNDVTLSTIAIGQVLRYDGSEWVNAKLSIDDLEMPAATAGQVLKFNGNKWVAGTDETGGGGASLNQPLSSINNAGLSAPSTANTILMWNGSAWVYTTIDAISFVDSDIDNTPRTLKQWITYVMNNAGMWEADTNNVNHIKPKNSQAVIAPGITSSTFANIAGALTVGGTTTSAGFYDSSISAS